MKTFPDKESRIDIPLFASITNSYIYNNYGTPDALLVANTNSHILVTSSVFENNLGYGRGSVGFADLK